MNNDRREFIKVMGTTTGVILAPSILSGSNKTNYYKDEYSSSDILNSTWEGHNANEKDIRINVLSYAILAPNPHNKQAWLINLKTENAFDLYIDQSRLLPQTDPIHRQIHIGQGTFLENLSISASYFGYKADISYFPKGEYSNTSIENKPVASIKLIKDTNIKKDKLFDFILLRRTNKSEYDNVTIKKEVLDDFKSQVAEFSNNTFELSNDVEKLRKIANKAMRIESSNKNRDLETIKMFRFNNDEVKKYRDGFGLAQNGTTGILKWIIETFFISREKALKDTNAFGQSTIELTEKQSNSTNTFAWLVTQNNTRLEQIKIGREYARINLIATSIGLSIHPMSQVLQEYSDMNKLQNEFLSYLDIPKEQTVQMFFRVGIATKTEHTSRREIKDIMI